MSAERRLHESVSIQQVADEVLGVSESTVRRLVERGKFPGAFRVGRQIRIPRRDLAAFQRENQVVRSQQN